VQTCCDNTRQIEPPAALCLIRAISSSHFAVVGSGPLRRVSPFVNRPHARLLDWSEDRQSFALFLSRCLNSGSVFKHRVEPVRTRCAGRDKVSTSGADGKPAGSASPPSQVEDGRLEAMLSAF